MGKWCIGNPEKLQYLVCVLRGIAIYILDTFAYWIHDFKKRDY